MKKLTFLGKIFIPFFILSVIFLIIILQLCQFFLPIHEREKDIPLSFKECPPIEDGIQFLENQTIVHKDVFFCTEIISKEHIPAKTMIRYVNGKTLLPLEETLVKATYNVRLRELSKNQWHIVANH